MWHSWKTKESCVSGRKMTASVLGHGAGGSGPAHAVLLLICWFALATQTSTLFYTWYYVAFMGFVPFNYKILRHPSALSFFNLFPYPLCVSGRRGGEGSYYIAQATLKVIILPLIPKCWDCRCVKPYPAWPALFHSWKEPLITWTLSSSFRQGEKGRLKSKKGLGIVGQGCNLRT